MLGDIILDLVDMLDTMQVANGYNYDYYPTDSPDVDCGETANECYIGLSFGEEEEITEGRAINQYRATIPVTFVARTPLLYDKIDQVETMESLARAKAKDDIKKRFANAHREVTDCITFEPIGEEEIQEDSNAFTCFLRYTWELQYKTPRDVS